MHQPPRDRPFSNLTAAAAAFAVYFCMYAFRKPFTAGTFEGQEVFGLGLKTVLVLSQLSGYMLSKFIGVKIVSEMPRPRRAVALLVLIGFAELALVGFAYLPIHAKVFMLFLNGLPLGLIFGIVLSYLEGRRQTEALAAGLCASFIVSSGIVKSVGRWLIVEQGVSEFQMPFITGAMFLPPLFFSVWLLQKTPEPTPQDREIRSERKSMTGLERREFFRAYAPGLSMLLFVYIVLTVTRTIRDDFGVEIWKKLGVQEQPSVFAQSETIVGIVATALNAFAICFVRNVSALRAATVLMCTGFVVAIGAALAQWQGQVEPFPFMVACGIGLYLPYVAFHTTVFERIVAASRHSGNLGFLMYVADSLGYLGYAAVVSLKMFGPEDIDILWFFRNMLLWGSVASIGAIVWALLYLQRVFLVQQNEDDLSQTGA
ncbi:MAG: hypothetical protein GY903_09490 [Fuerstiella sp.]|nr:hypothetical protein [Fuerstiella sp.]MCP4854712.1 hypothetical protein [Fuerstiella sp.]